jgi:hypothetical protein
MVLVSTMTLGSESYDTLDLTLRSDSFGSLPDISSFKIEFLLYIYEPG